MKNVLMSLLLLVTISSCCKKNKFSVDYGEFNRNDFEIYLLGELKIDTIPIYKDGIYYDIPDWYEWYGPHNWIITYKGQLQCEFGHLILNRRYTHKYKFVFYEKQDTLYCDINIRGKNSMKDTFYFTTIE